MWFYEVGPAAELFCENAQCVEFTGSVENLYLVDMDIFYDMVVSETYVFHTLCYDVL